MVSRGVGIFKFLKFSIDFLDFKRLNQPFKRSIWKKRSQGCNVLSPLIYLKVWKNCIYGHSCRRLPDSASQGVVFRLRISPLIRSPNRNGSNFSERNLCRTDFCKNPRKSASLPCPFKSSDPSLFMQWLLHDHLSGLRWLESQWSKALPESLLSVGGWVSRVKRGPGWCVSTVLVFYFFSVLSQC